MTRGLRIPVTPTEAASRAKTCLGLRLPPPGNRVGPRTAITYKLGAGGKEPGRSHPADWGGPTGRWLCDCSGFTAWCLGFDRYQPDEFPTEWINTDSMLADAERGGSWFAFDDKPSIGGLVVYGATYKGGRRIRVGHVALVVTVPAEFDPLEVWLRTRVIHCSSSASAKGNAITETDAALWGRRQGRWLRYLRAP